MNPLQPLLALLAQAERERDLAMADAQRAMQTHAQAAAQAEQLLTYRREYEQRWGAQFRNEGRMELVNCYRGFVDRLSQAVDQQHRIAQHASAQLDRVRATLLQHEVRVASVRKLVERRAVELRVAVDRIEQKQTDEFGARAAWNTSLGRNGLAHAV